MFLRLVATSSLSLLLTVSLASSCKKEKGEDSKQAEGSGSAGAGVVKNADGDKKTGHGQKKEPKHGLNAKPKLKIPAPDDVAAPPADAKKTASGLAYKVLKTSDTAGIKPEAADKVTVNYTGWTTDGEMFDTSKKRKAPAKFAVNRVIKGWTEGLQLMRKGETFRFWIPEELAYKGKSGPQGMLVFDVELLDVLAAPKAPEDVAKPPKGAKKTPKGVFYKVLTKGTGKEKPNSWDQVKVHYSGWTTDGKLFDSSITRGNPATFAVDRVIPGWTDALQLMTTGDKWRVWIPKPLAYDGMKGKPEGMLVFDVEILEIKRMPEPPKAPKDVAAPPKDAKKTATGVFYKILESSQGAKPVAASQVKVDYSGWTTDGKMFDSSITRGTPASFSLQRVVQGWRDGLLEMRVGEKARLWIPEELAYKGKQGAPKGMLVFDVHLIEIVK